MTTDLTLRTFALGLAVTFFLIGIIGWMLLLKDIIDLIARDKRKTRQEEDETRGRK